MKKTFIAILVIGLICAAVGPSLASEVTAQTGLDYEWWKDNKDSKGSQFIVPLKVQGSKGNLDIRLLTAYSYTTLTRGSEPKASIHNFTDTKLGASYAIAGKLPFDVMLGLDLNLPTGKTNLTAEQVRLTLDPDLVTINRFGEGFNVNPTLTIAKGWGPWVVGIGAGYLWRGEYDFSEDVQDYKPGWIFNTNAEVRYYFSDDLHVSVFGGLAWFGEDKIQDKVSYQEGDFSTAGAALYYKQPKWDAHASIRGVFRGRVKIAEDSEGLVTDPEKTYGDEFYADLFVRYALNDKTSVHSSLNGFFRAKNGFPSDAPFFSGRRDKVSLGLGVSRRLSKDFEGTLGVKGFLMHDGDTNFPEQLSARNYRGLSASLMLTKKF